MTQTGTIERLSNIVVSQRLTWRAHGSAVSHLTIKVLPPMPGKGAWRQVVYDRYVPEPEILTTVVHWYVDPEGQHGKTTLLKRMALALDFYLLGGGPQKMKFQMAKNPKKGYYVSIWFGLKKNTFLPRVSRICPTCFYVIPLEATKRECAFAKAVGSSAWLPPTPEAGKLSENRNHGIKVFN